MRNRLDVAPGTRWCAGKVDVPYLSRVSGQNYAKSNVLALWDILHAGTKEQHGVMVMYSNDSNNLLSKCFLHHKQRRILKHFVPAQFLFLSHHTTKLPPPQFLLLLIHS